MLPYHRIPVFSQATAYARLFLGLTLLSLMSVVTHAANSTDEKTRAFDIPQGEAEKTLRLFSEQAGVQVIYPADSVKDVRTNAVQGNFTSTDALQRMVAGTVLVMVRDDGTGALGIKREPARETPRPKLAREVVEKTDPAVASASPSSDLDRVVLSPFSVNASKDTGFVAASALAGGRIATALKDTPVAYSVVTAEFIEAFNISDVTEAAQWTVNSSVVDGDGNTRAFGSSSGSSIRTRGVSVNQATRNFFPYATTADSYNLDRVDFARGPNAVLFGAGGVGGTVNSVTKQANLSRNFEEVRVQLGSYNHYRIIADVNRAVNEKFGVRANVLWDQSDTWRDNEWTERRGAHLAATYKITPRLSIRGEAEYTKSRELKGTTALRDRLSAWDGITTFSAIPTTLPTAAQLAAAGILQSPMRWVTNPAFGGNVLNFQNRYVTKGAAQNNTLSLTNLINGVPIRTVGFTLNNQAMIDDTYGVPADRYARALAGSQYFTIPDRETTTNWSNKLPSFTETGKDLSLVMNYQLGSSLFFELAGDVNKGAVDAQVGLARRGGQDVYIDIDSTLPGGGVNPNFLHPFTEFMDYHTYRWNTHRSLRAQAIYIKETPVGKLQLSGMAGLTETQSDARSMSLLLPLKSRAPDARSWVDNNEYSEYGVYTRFYLDQPNRTYRPSTAPVTLVDPVTGITQTVTPTWMYDTRREDTNNNSLRKYRFLQAAGNFDLFKNRLVLIGAFRRDFTLVSESRVMAPGDMPAGWDGTSVTFRKDAPADYFDLTYFPKNAAGVITGPATPADSRPRTNINGANLPQPQYANDRFRNDYNSPALKANINTFTTGAVVNVTRWLGLYGNVSETFNLTAAGQSINGTLIPPSTSHGTDYGVRVTLPNGRLSLSVGAFNSYQAGARIAAVATGEYNAIADAPVVGDLSPTGRNNRNMAPFPVNVYSTATSETNGYEFELTANFTKAWRLMLNAGYSDPKQTEKYPDIIKYFETQDATVRLILGDAGVLIDTNKQASINPVLNDPTKINQVRVQAAVNGWNNLVNSVIPNTVTQIPQATEGSSKWVGNIATDYRISTGYLKGVRVGFGINYRSGQVVGYRGSDTIVNPANPTVAIDDPTVDAGTSVYAPSYYKGVASLSYTFRLKNKRTLQLDLNVDNLFNRATPVFGSNGNAAGTNRTNLRPRPGETIASPARYTVAGNFFYLTPRSYTLSAKLSF